MSDDLGGFRSVLKEPEKDMSDQMNGQATEAKPANPAAVSLLEQLLARAKRGEIHGFMFVGVTPEGLTFEAPIVANAIMGVALLGANEILRANICNALLQARLQQQQPGIVRAQQVPDVSGLFRR